jgi:hypothetical protein
MAGGNPYTKKRGGFHGGRGGGGGGGGGRGSGPSSGPGGRGGGGGGGGPEPVLEALLKLVFEKQQSSLFDPNLGMLNLSNLSQCEDIAGKTVDFNSATFCKTLVSVIKQKVGNPRFINANNNNIKSLSFFLKALIDAKVHDSIGGLSLANNKIGQQDFIPFLAKFSSLQEIVLAGNPVRNQSGLVPFLRKKIPTLLGIDGESIVRQPLSLPWPKRSNFDDNQRFMLEMIESNLLQQLSKKQFESAVSLFSENALFSFCVPKEGLFNAGVKGDHKAVQGDFGKFKGDLTHNSRSVIESGRLNNLATNRISIAHSLRQNLYRDDFNVMHQLSANASVVFFDVPLMKIPTCVLTVHGRILWQHCKVQSEERILCFDRTFSLTFVEGSWSITSDLVTIRANSAEPLFFADNPSKLLALERTLSIPHEVAAAMVKQCASDLEFSRLLDGVGSPQLLMECCKVSNNNFDHAVLAARIATARQTDAQTAYNQLAANNFAPPQ